MSEGRGARRLVVPPWFAPASRRAPSRLTGRILNPSCHSELARNLPAKPVRRSRTRTGIDLRSIALRAGILRLRLRMTKFRPDGRQPIRGALPCCQSCPVSGATGASYCRRERVRGTARRSSSIGLWAALQQARLSVPQRFEGRSSSSPSSIVTPVVARGATARQAQCVWPSVGGDLPPVACVIWPCANAGGCVGPVRTGCRERADTGSTIARGRGSAAGVVEPGRPLRVTWLYIVRSRLPATVCVTSHPSLPLAQSPDSILASADACNLRNRQAPPRWKIQD